MTNGLKYSVLLGLLTIGVVGCSEDGAPDSLWQTSGAGQSGMTGATSASGTTAASGSGTTAGTSGTSGSVAPTAGGFDAGAATGGGGPGTSATGAMGGASSAGPGGGATGPDADADGTEDESDNCPMTANPDQADGDADGVGDACDICPADADPDQADGDEDGVGNACDNCAATANPDQADSDSDGFGDLCSCGNPIVRCEGGKAGPHDCQHVDLLASFTPGDFGSRTGNDVWGYVDPESGREIAVAGLNDGMAFVDVTQPQCPEVLGKLASGVSSNLTRDVKVLGHYAIAVAEARGQGMQVFDLKPLLDGSAPSTLAPVTTYTGGSGNTVSNAHNVAVIEGGNYAYIVASGSCSRGVHVVDMTDPTSPQFAGCYDQDTAIHDVQCVAYAGPDEAYAGKDLCLTLNGNSSFSVVDMTNKSSPSRISRTQYEGGVYSHQGWLTEDHRYFLLGDELDEQYRRHDTKTHIFDVSDLDSPSFLGTYQATTPSTDHNMYTHNGLTYQANYTSGVRILDNANVASGTLEEIAFFDTVPSKESVEMDGAWSVYPYFPSGTMLVNGMNGLFILRLNDPRGEGVPQ